MAGEGYANLGFISFLIVLLTSIGGLIAAVGLVGVGGLNKIILL